MPNRLSRWCDGLMEAGWLLAISLTPLFFNTYSARSFEPDKTTLLRSIAWLVLAAWLVKLLAEGGPRFERFRAESVGSLRAILQLPLAAPAAALGGLYLVGTLVSVSPHASLFGSYQRGQGTLTLFAYLIVFATAAANLRGRAAVNRLISVICLTSLPVSLYGILQRYGADPLPWGADVSGRVTSSLGNAIFLAAYLIMAMPLAAAQALGALRALMREEGSVNAHAVRAALYVLIFATDAIAVWFTGSRGPLLGLLAAEFLFGLLVFLLWRRRGLLLAWLALHGLAAGFLVMLNIPDGPLESLRSGTSTLGRLGHIAGEQTTGTGAVRIYIARTILDLMTPHPPLVYPDGSPDKWNVLRPLIGYGPESLYVANSQYYDPQLAHVESRTAAPDRAHNETLDAFAITGLLGVLAYVALFTAVFYYGLVWLGLIQSRGQQRAALGLMLGGGVLGALAAAMVQREYVGLGLPLAMLAGLVVYLVALAFRPAPEPAPIPDPLRTFGLVAVLAAIAAHFVELQFGIGIAATRTHFWLYAALLFVLGMAWSPQPTASAASPAQAARGSKRKQRAGRGAPAPGSGSWSGAWVTAGILLVFGLTLGFIFINNPLHATSLPQIVSDGWFARPAAEGGRAPAFGAAGLLALTWLVGSILLTLEDDSGPGAVKRWAAGLSLALAGSLVTWLVLAARLSAIAAVIAKSLEDLLHSGDQIASMLGLYYLMLTLAGLALSVALARAAPAASARPAPAWLTYFAAPALAVLAVFLAVFINLRAIQADSYNKLGQQLEGDAQPELAATFYQRAVDYDPGEDNYYLLLARARLNFSLTLNDAAQQGEHLQQTLAVLRLARQLNPLNTDHSANLARLMRQWALLGSDPAVRAQRAAEADRYYAQALRLSPNSALLWNEWATYVYQVLEDPDRAQSLLDRSFAVDNVWEQTYQAQGELYIWRAGRATDPAVQADFYRRAAAAYEQGIATVGPDGNLTNLYVDLAAVHIARKEYQLAVDAYLQLAALLPDNSPNRWEVFRAIAGLYQLQGNSALARQYALEALAIAPDDKRPELQALLDSLP